MKLFKKVLGVVAVLLLAVVSTVVVRALAATTRQVSVPAAARVKIDETAAIERLSGALRIETVSFDDPRSNDYGALVALRSFIEARYPLVAKTLKRTVINDYSLLFEWKGTNPDDKPIILAAHQDVVPVDPSEWTHEAFSGQRIDGAVWGRGALDDKGSLFAILEAVEYLASSGFTPRRTVYLAFGHDEEAGTTGGMQGARNIAAHLKSAGVHAESILDEGGVIADGELSLVKGKKLALIGVAEKGFVTLKITARGPSGHAMMPPKDTTIALLARAVTALDENPMPSSLDGVVGLTLDCLAPEMPFLQRAVLTNRWLFGPAVRGTLAKSNLVLAMMHTTMAPTMIQGGVKEQSLPASATVVVNARILPRETSSDVIRHVERSIADPRITVERYGPVVHEPTPLSRPDGPGYRAIERAAREAFPGVLVAPMLVTGRTDSLYYKEVADEVYRFAPYLYRPGDDKRPHGRDEFIRVEDYLDMIQFYVLYIESYAAFGSRL